MVGDALWTFDKSDSDHRLKGGFVRGLSDLGYRGFFQHNISHAATADYAAKVDIMMLGNAGDATGEPRIDFFPGFSRYGPGSFLDWNDPVGTPRFSISLVRYAADGKTVLRSVFPPTTRGGASAVWVDDFRTVLVFGVGSTGLSATTLQLGRGTDDYSVTGYGTFQPGKGGTEFNGTARVLTTYNSTIKGTTQGADWHRGKLYVGWTATQPNARTIEVLELTLVSGGTLKLLNTYKHQTRRADGSFHRYETQGVTFRGDELLVAGIREDNQHSLYRFDSLTSATDLKP